MAEMYYTFSEVRDLRNIYASFIQYQAVVFFPVEEASGELSGSVLFEMSKGKNHFKVMICCISDLLFQRVSVRS